MRSGWFGAYLCVWPITPDLTHRPRAYSRRYRKSASLKHLEITRQAIYLLASCPTRNFFSFSSALADLKAMNASTLRLGCVRAPKIRGFPSFGPQYSPLAFCPNRDTPFIQLSRIVDSNDGLVALKLTKMGRINDLHSLMTLAIVSTQPLLLAMLACWTYSKPSF